MTAHGIFSRRLFLRVVGVLGFSSSDSMTDSGASLAALDRSDAVKSPCRVATNAHIGLNGLPRINGVHLAAGDRVLVKDQDNAVENGVYIARVGQWRRADDFSKGGDLVRGTRVWVANGNSGPVEAVVRSDGRIIPDQSDIKFDVVPFPAEIDISGLGAFSAAPAAAMLNAFQAAVDTLPAGGGVIVVPAGDFSALDANSLDIADKAITWDVRNYTTKLPADMKGIVLRSGIFSLPEASIQSNRSARVHNLYDLGRSVASIEARQYVHHVSGFLPDQEAAAPELELRAYSFDLGTDQHNVVDAVRGIKGRVYATAGQANIRAIYGFAESAHGGTHTGLLTGLLGTVYGNGRTRGDTVGVRGHVDGKTNGAFQAAGAKIGETNDPRFGFQVRGGTGAPLLPTGASFQTHGGGVGAMFQGVRNNVDLTIVFEVDSAGKLLAQAFRSGSITVGNNAVAEIIPPSKSGGIIRIFAENTDEAWATVFFRASGTHLCKAAGINGSLVVLSTSTLTGETGNDGTLTISCNRGVIQLENRIGAAKSFVYEFMSR
jgi:hypothetical protein